MDLLTPSSALALTVLEMGKFPLLFMIFWVPLLWIARGFGMKWAYRL